MTSDRRIKRYAFFALALSLVPIASYGTDGYFADGWGIRNKGMAGVGIATGFDATAALHNPATLRGLERRFDFSLEYFNPVRSYGVVGAPTGIGSFAPGKVKSQHEGFLIPTLGFVLPMRDGSTWGISISGNGGMNTDWPASANGGFGVYGDGEAGVNLEQMFITASYAKPLGETTLGASLVYVRQTFSAKGLQNFNPVSTTLSGNGEDVSTGLGFRLGATHQVNEQFRVGVNYAPKVNMTKFDRYSGLFAEQGNFDIPENLGIGFAFEPDASRLIELDIKHIRYSDVPAIGNPMANMVNGLGSDNGPGFGWRDMTIYKLGYAWGRDSDTTYRLGLSYGRQPIPSSEMLFNILAPGVQEWHFTGGFSKRIGNGEWSFALVYSPNKSISGANANDPSQRISLEMRQLEFELGYSVRF